MDSYLDLFGMCLSILSWCVPVCSINSLSRKDASWRRGAALQHRRGGGGAGPQCSNGNIEGLRSLIIQSALYITFVGIEQPHRLELKLIRTHSQTPEVDRGRVFWSGPKRDDSQSRTYKGATLNRVHVHDRLRQN